MNKKSSPLFYIRLVFAAMFFFSLHAALTSYINSTFMESMGWSMSIIDAIYTFSSVATLGAYILVPMGMRKFGNRNVMLVLLLVLALCLIGVVTISSPLIKILLFTLFLTLNFLVIYEIDVFLEHFSSFQNTGKIRGLFFMIINLAWAVSPFIAGQIIERMGISSVYIIAVVMVLITTTIFLTNFRSITFIQKPKRSVFEVIKTVRGKRDLRSIFSLSLMLHFFYAVAVIYMPLYLYDVIGFSWGEIGLLLLLANVPFLILGFPVGKLADEYIGEKEMMMGSLVVASIGTFGFVFMESHSFASWAAVLIVSRIGISVLETTTESYFFKKVDRDDSEVMSIQRNAIPLAYLLAPLSAFTIGLITHDYRVLFALVAVLLLFALYPASLLRDTK